ncbi:hypothetical protein ABMA27_003506 [Loxostege sticticalis]|uniref:PiggyBac transposable element-derived protein domain-containing protein n=1 Tax=Loxostege sticticalis TaxID=481309 RepID=A0ABR3HTB8_LOXSC
MQWEHLVSLEWIQCSSIVVFLKLLKQQWLAEEDARADQQVSNLIGGSVEFNWSNDPGAFKGQREEFRCECGPQFDVSADMRPLDIFLKFFTDDVLNLLVDATNKYMNRLQQPLQEHSRFRDCKETSKEEICVFISILMFQGLMPVPKEQDYWKENGYLSLPGFRALMPRNRFLFLKRMLHFSSPEDEQLLVNCDIKLRKIQPLINLLRSKFRSLYLPSRDIAIDESLLKWHSRLSFVQKIATKAAKAGIKSYELCESHTGYLWDFIVYSGKGTQHGEEQDQEEPSNMTAKIVIDLVRPLLNRGHTLTMDNFYNSPFAHSLGFKRI